MHYGKTKRCMLLCEIVVARLFREKNMDNESSRDDKLESILQDGSSEPRSLPLEYLRNITNNFSDGQLLGIGGFGKVYKGTRQNGECIAVKKLDQLKPSIQKPQFENEVYHLMRLKHPNIVRLVGYCYETRNECVFYDGKYVFAEMPQKLVCLEYLPNGSLERHLSDESSGLDWCTRYRIIRGTCFGLHYLHEECKSQLNASIIHLDLKPANILLDDNMVPKIADFGLSKILDMGKTQTRTTFPAGSLGYMAPEYIHQHKISTKADIYSLGVVIIEVITGRMFGPSGIETLFCGDFVEPVLKIWRNRLEATPTCTSLETDCQQIEICLEIGLSCTNFYPEKRPTTMKVIEMLNRCESTNSYESDEERLAANQIRGARPPLLSPPPPIGALAPPPVRRSFVDDYMTASTWDIVQSFAPREGSELGERVDTRCNLDTEEENEAEDGVAAVEGELKIKRKSKSWMRGALLGSGSFGMVYEGINDEGVFFAVKEVSFLDQGSNAQQSIVALEQEIVLLSQFEHENIVQYYGTDKEESKLYIFIELVTQGSLSSLYRKYELRESQVSAYTRQILNGLVYLHERNVVHRDIKCANILVHANGSVKLADFGLAKEMSKINMLRSCKGSVYWMAPEVINPKKMYGPSADIWSLGCTVLEMLTRQIPFPNVEWTNAFFMIGRGEQPTIPNYLSKEAQDFIGQCVRVDPESRPSASQLLEHPFVNIPLRTSFESSSPPAIRL